MDVVNNRMVGKSEAQINGKLRIGCEIAWRIKKELSTRKKGRTVELLFIDNRFYNVSRVFIRYVLIDR